MRFLIFLLLVIFRLTLPAQDTLTVMHYNLLYFGVDFGECDPNGSNNVNDKIEDLKIITAYVKPDIVTVNELSQNDFYHELILDNVFNINGISYFKKCDPPNISGSNIVNQVFYNSQKLTFLSQIPIAAGVRDLDIIKFMYNEPGEGNDTIFLNCVVAHLKAGSGSSDEQQRAVETLSLMSYLNDVNASGNFLFMGDLNLYSDNEQAFQNLINHYNESIRFYDPVNKMGSWNNNDYYRNYHTQSTHTDSYCFTSGGLDDRFDFILISDEIKIGNKGIQYIDDTYWAVGQDGQHFNTSLLDYPDNTSVPQSVLAALYGMSDHLPVKLDLLVDKSLGIAVSMYKQNVYRVYYNNADGQLVINGNEFDGLYQVEILDITGRTLFTRKIGQIKGDKWLYFFAGKLTPGIYLANIRDRSSTAVPVKFIVTGN